MAGIDSKFDKAYAGKSVEELADAPVAALNGVSDSDAEHLKAGVQHQDRPRPRNEQVLPVGAGHCQARRVNIPTHVISVLTS